MGSNTCLDEYSWSVIISGILLTIFTALVLIVVFQKNFICCTGYSSLYGCYIFCCLTCYSCIQFREFPIALATIVQSAFGLRAVGVGAIGSYDDGYARWVLPEVYLSNEAGLEVVLLLLLPLPLLMHLHSRGLISMIGYFY